MTALTAAAERLRARVTHYRGNVEFLGSQTADDIEAVLDALAAAEVELHEARARIAHLETCERVAARAAEQWEQACGQASDREAAAEARAAGLGDLTEEAADLLESIHSQCELGDGLGTAIVTLRNKLRADLATGSEGQHS